MDVRPELAEATRSDPPPKPFKIVNSIDLSRMEALYKHIGFDPSHKVMHRLNSLGKQNQLKQKIEQIWARVSKINRENEQQFESFQLPERHSSKLKKSLQKSRSNGRGNIQPTSKSRACRR